MMSGVSNSPDLGTPDPSDVPDGGEHRPTITGVAPDDGQSLDIQSLSVNAGNAPAQPATEGQLSVEPESYFSRQLHGLLETYAAKRRSKIAQKKDELGVSDLSKEQIAEIDNGLEWDLQDMARDVVDLMNNSGKTFSELCADRNIILFRKAGVLDVDFLALVSFSLRERDFSVGAMHVLRKYLEVRRNKVKEARDSLNEELSAAEKKIELKNSIDAIDASLAQDRKTKVVDVAERLREMLGSVAQDMGGDTFEIHGRLLELADSYLKRNKYIAGLQQAGNFGDEDFATSVTHELKALDRQTQEDLLDVCQTIKDYKGNKRNGLATAAFAVAEILLRGKKDVSYLRGNKEFMESLGEAGLGEAGMLKVEDFIKLVNKNIDQLLGRSLEEDEPIVLTRVVQKGVSDTVPPDEAQA